MNPTQERKLMEQFHPCKGCGEPPDVYYTDRDYAGPACWTARCMVCIGVPGRSCKALPALKNCWNRNYGAVAVKPVETSHPTPQPGTLLLASSRCPFCGSRLDVIPETASSGHKGHRGFCTGALGTFGGEHGTEYQQPVCDVGPRVWKPTRDEAIAAICRRA